MKNKINPSLTFGSHPYKPDLNEELRILALLAVVLALDFGGVSAGLWSGRTSIEVAVLASTFVVTYLYISHIIHTTRIGQICISLFLSLWGLQTTSDILSRLS